MYETLYDVNNLFLTEKVARHRFKTHFYLEYLISFISQPNSKLIFSTHSILIELYVGKTTFFPSYAMCFKKPDKQFQLLCSRFYKRRSETSHFGGFINETRRQVGVNSGLIKLGEEPGYEVDVTSCKG